MADIKQIRLPDNEVYNIKDPVARTSIGYGVVDSTSTSTVFTATIEGVTSYYDGLAIMLKNGVVTSASGFTININGLGAKPVYQNMAAASAETTIFNINYTMLFVYDSTRISGGAWICYRGYNSDTTTGRGLQDYYFRGYAGSAIYRYKLLMQGENNRLYPIVTTNQTDATQVAKVPQTVGLRPWNIWYYNSTTTISAGSAIGAQTLLPAIYTTGAAYNFNASIATYRWIYLCGTYNADTDLFTLYNDGSSPCTSYYVQVPQAASLTLSSYFTSGYYYLLVGGSYSTANYISLFAVNPFYYFDGTNLIPVSTKIAKDQAGTSGVTSLNLKTGALTLLTASIGSASAGTAIAADDITNWSTNVPTQVTAKTVVTSVTPATVVTGGSKTNIPNVTGVGTLPSLAYTSRTVGSASGWSAGTAATATYSNGILTISNGTAPTLTITNTSCDDITSWSSGTLPTLGTAIGAYTSLTTGTAATVSTGDSVTVSKGQAATLSYTARSIPNISVDATTVVTGVTSIAGELS